MTDQNTDPNLFVCAGYVKASKKIEKVIIDGHEEFFIPEVRNEELPRWKMSEQVKGVEEEAFDKNKTVWKPWVSDTPGSLAGAFRADMGHWRAYRFIKDPEDMRQV